MRLGITGAIGALLVLIGVSMLLKAVFGVDLPMVKAALALAFIYGGITLVINRRDQALPSSQTTDNTAILTSRDCCLATNGPPERDALAIAAKMMLDATKIAPKSASIDVNVQAIASDVTILVHPDVPLRIEVRAAVADCTLPDGNKIAVGTLFYHTPGVAADVPVLNIEITAVFAIVRFVHPVLDADRDALGMQPIS